MANRSFHEDAFGLAIETATPVGSVAIGRGASLLEERALSGPRRHAADLMPTIDALCRTHGCSAAQVSWIHVSAGPGSFTGLRIGMTVARMISLSHDAALVPVPTLEVLAQNALRVAAPPATVIAILDAKRQHVYGQAFRLSGCVYEPIDEVAEHEPGAYVRQFPQAVVLGAGIMPHRDVVDAAGLPVLQAELNDPRAREVFRLGVARARHGAAVARRALVPIYVRRPEVEEKWEAMDQSRRKDV